LCFITESGANEKAISVNMENDTPVIIGSLLGIEKQVHSPPLPRDIEATTRAGIGAN
jgi:hypothetical protein